MATNEIKLKLTIEGKEAIASLNLTEKEMNDIAKTLRTVNDSSRDAGQSIVHNFANARNLIQGFKETLDVLTQAFGTHITAYQDQEKALVQLKTAMQQAGTYTDEAYNRLNNYAAQLQSTTIYADEVTQSVMAQLTAMGLNTDQVIAATEQTANLASLMGSDLNAAARVMADLFEGNATMIKRYIKGLDETVLKSGDLNQIIGMLNKSIGNQAVALGDTAYGSMIKFDNAMGELKESTGALLSEALNPLATALADVIVKLNGTDPALSGVIGLSATLTTAFITLRITGIIPAIASLEVFGVTLTGVRLALLKSGIGALLVALGYAFVELSKSYNNYQDTVQKGELSKSNLLAGIDSEASKKKKKELEFDIDASKQRQEDLEKEIGLLESKKKTSYGVEQTSGGQFGGRVAIKVETEKTKEITNQIKLQKEQLDIEGKKQAIYEKYLNPVKSPGGGNNGSNADKIKQQATESFNLEQQHQLNMQKLTDENNLNLLAKEKTLLEKKKEFYQQYGQDVIAIEYAIAEKELEIKNANLQADKDMAEWRKKTMGSRKDELKSLGDVSEYQRKTKQEELDLWVTTETRKAASYRNTNEVLQQIDNERAARQKDIDDEVAANRIAVTQQSLNFVAGAFAEHTAFAKMISAGNAIMSTYEAASVALTAGPILGPILAGLITAAGLANVAKIMAVEPPQATGYAKGGMAMIGENGPELIAPAMDYAQGQAMLINAVIGKIGGAEGNAFNEQLLTKLDDWQKNLEFRISRGDLYTANYNEQKFRERNSY